MKIQQVRTIVAGHSDDTLRQLISENLNAFLRK